MRDAQRIDPATGAARIRAMYTHPAHARQGIGRLILSLCEAAASAGGYRRVELMATPAGLPLYQACGYTCQEQVTAQHDGISVPLVRMSKFWP